jgi:hypothetical protein
MRFLYITYFLFLLFLFKWLLWYRKKTWSCCYFCCVLRESLNCHFDFATNGGIIIVLLSIFHFPFFLILKTKYDRTASGKRIETQTAPKNNGIFLIPRNFSASNGPYFHKHWNKMIKKRSKAKILMPFLILVPCARGKIWFIGIANKCCFFPRVQSFFQSHYKHFSMLCTFYTLCISIVVSSV